MININRFSFIKYLLFGSLYFSEGLIKVISTLILPLYFNEKGVPPELITLAIGVAATPMIIKFIWGGIVDYFIIYGRKRFIIIGCVLSVISLFILTFIDPEIALLPFAILLFISWCGVGFLDVSSDALAIEISREEERGKINGAMYAGQNAGMAIGALILPFVAQNFGYQNVFPISGLLILLIIIFPLIIKENRIVKKHQKVGILLINEFKKKTTILITLFSITISLSSGMLLLLIPLYLNLQLNLDDVTIGFIVMVFTIATALGSLIGGILADKLGRKKALFLLIWLSIIFTALLIFTNNWQNFTIIYGLIGFLQGAYIASYLSLFMDFTNPQVGATQFSIFTGFGNLGIISVGALSGTLYVILGFSRTFLYAAWIFGPALLILYFINLKRKI